ncbi:pentapeptide repeat-containing protein [Bailinhaonella thermotolerans]|nr:pentapeptide repeat-containing protein [Bailinhaonella thermotolerans]
MGLRWMPRGRAGGSAEAPAPVREPRSALWWIVPAAAGIGGAIAVTAWWLLAALPPLPGAVLASARVEIVRTALAAGTGIGAAIALMLAFRRQRHQEIAAAHTTHDATERRVTELYTKAVEQLGNARAPVRLGGLYALERLAQDNPAHRQTIVNVICAYLRMPYAPPREPGAHERMRAAQRAARARRAGRPAEAGTDPQEERQVRLAAQRILADHLIFLPDPYLPPEHRRRPPERLWPDVRLDLTGATLLDADFSGCQIHHGVFTGALFTGTTRFTRARLTGAAQFTGARFTGTADFSDAHLPGSAEFGRAAFTGDARFVQARLTFARFDEAEFAGEADFTRAEFIQEVRFDRAVFADRAAFAGAAFDTVTFAGARVEGAAGFGPPAGGGSIPGAVFRGEVSFAEVRGAERVELEGARAVGGWRGSGWPPGWRAEPGPDGGEVIRRTGPDPDATGPEPDATGPEPDATGPEPDAAGPDPHEQGARAPEEETGARP